MAHLSFNYKGAMMRAMLKNISSPDVELTEYWPEDEFCFGFSLELQIGSRDSLGGDLFAITVCTPDWIKARYADRKALWGRHLLIVFKFDLGEIKLLIDQYIGRCEADDWNALALKLSRFAHWEFEDYQS